jgi:hypothetical protein
MQVSKARKYLAADCKEVLKRGFEGHAELIIDEYDGLTIKLPKDDQGKHHVMRIGISINSYGITNG